MSISLHRCLAAIESSLETSSRSQHSDFYNTLGWYRNFVAACLDDGDRLALYEVEGEGGSRAGLPMRERVSRVGPLKVRTLSSLTNYYTCSFSPYGFGALREPAVTMAAWAAAVRADAARPHRIRFDALDPRSPAFEAIAGGLRSAGYWIEAFPHFGNWHLEIEDRDFGRYWGARQSALRRTVERKERGLRRARDVSVETYNSPQDSDTAVEGYEYVYARSWKRAEPYSRFIPGLIRTGFATGALDVGILKIDQRPAAAQIWIRSGSNATIYKLAHDQELERWSVGSILTRSMIEQAFADPTILSIDFGRGDDPYKKLWLPKRRERWGIIAFDPRSVAGLCLALRNFGPGILRRAGNRLRGRS